MARENTLRLRGAVTKDPTIVKRDDEYLYAQAKVAVVRAARDTGNDPVKDIVVDIPLIMTRDVNAIKEIESWKANDIVDIKGVLTCKRILKGSHCHHCNARNSVMGVLVYVLPIFAEKIVSLKDSDECMRYLAEHREISNNAFVIGTVVNEPKFFAGKGRKKPNTLQYQIALNRKYRITTDDPNIRTDYPWVKSYGLNALEDKERLIIGSEVMIDGCIQAREFSREVLCGQLHDEIGDPVFDDDGNPVFDKRIDGCGEKYSWYDRTLEIVPYTTEYLTGYMTDLMLGKIDEDDVKKGDYSDIFE